MTDSSVLRDSAAAIAALNAARDGRPWVFGYGRASDEKQVLTIDAQLYRCLEWYNTEQRKLQWNNIPPGPVLKIPDTNGSCNPFQKPIIVPHAAESRWIGFFADEAVSGSTDWELRRMGSIIWNAARSGDTIVAALFDRPCRSTLNWLQTAKRLISRNIRLMLLDMPDYDYTTPTGCFLFTVMAATKQLERETIGARTKEGLAVKIRKGLPYSQFSPIGWAKLGMKKNSFFIPDNSARLQCLYLVKLHDLDGLSWNQIDVLNRKLLFAPLMTYKRLATSSNNWRTSSRKNATQREFPHLWGLQQMKAAYSAALAGFPKSNGDREQSFPSVDLFDTRNAILALLEQQLLPPAPLQERLFRQSSKQSHFAALAAGLPPTQYPPLNAGSCEGCSKFFSSGYSQHRNGCKQLINLMVLRQQAKAKGIS